MRPDAMVGWQACCVWRGTYLIFLCIIISDSAAHILRAVRTVSTIEADIALSDCAYWQRTSNRLPILAKNIELVCFNVIQNTKGFAQYCLYHRQTILYYGLLCTCFKGLDRMPYSSSSLQVVEGLDIIKKIENSPTGRNDVPKEKVVITDAGEAWSWNSWKPYECMNLFNWTFDRHW